MTNHKPAYAGTTDADYILPVSEQLNIHTYRGSFMDGARDLARDGLKPASTAELAEARIRAGLDHPLSQESIWVGEAYICLPNREMLIVDRDHNPFLTGTAKPYTYRYNRFEHDDLTHEYHRLDDPVAKQLRERAETDPDKAIKSGVLLFNRKDYPGDTEIPADELDKQAPTRFLFREFAKPYAELLKAQDLEGLRHFYSGNPHESADRCQNCCRGIWYHGIYKPKKPSTDPDHRHDPERFMASEIFVDEVNPDSYNATLAGIQRVPGQWAISGLEGKVLRALERKKPFRHDGTVYVPASLKDI
jgi:hypothetical protein